ncbi:MAG: iron-containing alcohol dehydrogenase [Chloroflexi bacterium]|nr:iron-containing alcohol dehydrogenase [Chloroflexota bacterium]MCI0579940.1 iron-containing alcohol dehydrogenase [Chloroflexota bacterium]MCI0646523.1 iron-containing alcohol dehydrogenase [Chloroflexota bacterium]MCI0726125.1 iron-containing alcohol dehydrogenase [Chloroflexota bacterium]
MTGLYTSLPLEKVLYGPGSVASLPAEVDRLGGRRVFIVTGRTLADKTPLVKRLVMLLGYRHAGTFAGIQQHVPESGIDEAAKMAHAAQADLLLSVGGGSPIDAAKSVALALADEEHPPLLHVAVPTTLSAAEFSHIAGYTVESTRSKSRVIDPRLTPRVAILDPEMTLATPAWLWSSSGIRALDHAVETLYAPGDHPVQDVLALQAIADLFAGLPAARQRPDDLAVRLRCQLAAWMSFFAPATIQYGLSHALGKAFGPIYSVPHGVTSCITLPPVMRYMAATHAGPLARMARALGLAGPEMPDQQAALAAAGSVADLIRRLELPGRLRDVKVPREGLARIAGAVAGDGSQQADVLRILEEVW